MRKYVLIALVFFLCLGITGCKNEETKKKDYPNDIYVEEELIGKTVTIEFDSNGGTEVEKISIKTNEVITQPEEPTKEGYIFLGWYNKEELFDFSKTPKTDIVLVAKWDEIKAENIIVTFNSNGGSAVSKQILTENQKIKKPNNPTRNGYTFLYWELDNKEFDFNSEINNNIVLTAKWKSIWEDGFEKYRTNSFSLPRCYMEQSTNSNKYGVAEKVNIGDRIVCYAVFENFNGDDVKALTYTLTYGSGLKLIGNKNSSDVIQNGNTYSITYDKPVGMDDGIGAFIFEVVQSYDLTFGIKDIKFITSDNRKYYTDLDVNSLTYAWDVTNATFTRYRADSFGMAHCYTEESVLANKYQEVKNVNVGDRIVCDSYFETYSTEKVKTFKYTLNYGSGLKLIKANYSGAIKDGNTFLYTLDKATSVGDYGSFTFEVVGTENLTYGLSDIKFITDDFRYYYTGNENNTLNYVWNSNDITFNKHTGHSFSMTRCYNTYALQNGKFERVTSVKVGDRISCMLGLEIDSPLKVKSFKFSVTHGSGLSLVVDNLSDALRENNTYIYTLKSPTSFFEEYTKFTFDVVSTENLTYGLSDIKFITSNNGYYYTDNITYSLK